MEILVVVNPKAGTKRKKALKQKIVDYLTTLCKVEVVYWESANEDITAKILNKLKYGEYSYVVSIGGDGTVNRVARALIGRKEALLIIPMGSGNGLARHLKIPMNPLKAAQLLVKGKTVAIDAVRLHDDYYFCTAGVGFDAHVAHLFANAGKRGLSTYVRMVLRSFFAYKPQSYTIVHRDQKTQLQAFFITIANANQWGNNVKVAPQANISDGKLEFIALLPFKWYHLPGLVYKLFCGKFHLSSGVFSAQSESFVLISNEAMQKGHYDGEPVMFPSEIVFESMHQSLHVVVPENFS